jgi:hypothetical protein
MKSRWFLILCIFVITPVSAFAQTKTVTNFELERYKQQRLQAEKDLNENYKELGFPSLEERERRLESWKKDNNELAELLRRERIEQENADAQAQQAAALATQQQYYPQPQPAYPAYGGDVFYSYGYQSLYGYHHRFRPFPPRPLGYFAGGAFWPAPSPVRIPIFVRPVPPRPRH